MLALKCDICGNFYINELPSDQQHIRVPSSITFEYNDHLDWLPRKCAGIEGKCGKRPL